MRSLLQLDNELLGYQQAAYAESSKSTYRSQIRAFLRFCIFFNLSTLPASMLTLCRYVSFLARTIKPSCIKGYLNAVRILHLDHGYDNPLGAWRLNRICKGVERIKGTPSVQKLPITVDILLEMSRHLDKTLPVNITFWAASLVAFFTFARKSTILVKSAQFDPAKALCRRDLSLTEFGMIVTFRHTKTIQVCERVLQVPIHHAEDSPLCPVQAVRDLLQSTHKATPTTPLFCFKNGKGALIPMTQHVFSKCLRRVLEACGLPADQISGHSFRRGGASFAFAAGVPARIIKLHGDWKSSAYERYIHVPMDNKIRVAKVLSLSV